MILFLAEHEANIVPMRHFVSMAMQAGEAPGLLVQPAKPTPARLAMDHYPHECLDIAGFQIYQEGAMAETLRSDQYGADATECCTNAIRWYGHYWREFEAQMYANGLDHVVTWGSSRLGNKAALLAAEGLGLKTSVLEDGLFPHQNGRTFVVSPRRAYYESPEWPESWQASFDNWQREEYRANAQEEYWAWWRDNRATKYSGTQRQELLVHDGADFPREWREDMDPRAVWFGQVNGDAALYWCCEEEDWAEMAADAAERSAWFKPHPFTHVDADQGAGLRHLPACLNVHDVLAETDEVMVMTSNVGLEAWALGKQVHIYGNPWYKGMIPDRNVLVNAADLSGLVSLSDAGRKLALGWIAHGLQFNQHDARGFVDRLKAGH